MNEITDFSSLGLSEQMLAAIQAKGFEAPTAIQSLTIPRLLSGEQDIVAQSQTGTGKTAAFGLPILQSIESSKNGAQAIILVPTRELAIQAAEELYSFNKERKLAITAIYGGASMSEQLRRLSKGVDVVVGTPGRVLDHIRRGTLHLGNIKFLVLDEADEMLNMGFVEDVEEIMSGAAEDRRVLLFSATMPRRILDLSKKYMHNPEILRIESQQLTADLTEQIYFEVREGDKFDALTRIIDIEAEFYGIVFSRTKVGVDELVNRLVERGYAAEGLHGDVSQAQREKTLKKFKSKAANILVATDVAARGVDIANLSHVINYSLPQDSESYVHRIGRTGRAGNSGTAITFISSSEFRRFNFMVRDIKADVKKEQLPTGEDIVAIKRAKIKADLDEIITEQTYGDYADIAQSMLAEHEPEVALSALLRLAFRGQLDQSSYPEIRSFSVDRKGTARIFIAMGSRDGYTARQMVDVLKQRCSLRDKHIDDVRIFDNYSFVTVPFNEAERVVGKLNAFSRGDRPMAEIAKDKDGSRSERGDRGDRGGRSDRGERRGRSDRGERGDRGERSGRSDRRSSFGDRSDRDGGNRRERRAADRGDSASNFGQEKGAFDSFTRKSEEPAFERQQSDDQPKRSGSNEEFDWNAFMKFDEGSKWGRDENGKERSTKSVRKSPRKITSAASRMSSKRRR